MKCLIRDLSHCEEGIISAKFTLSLLLRADDQSLGRHENANQIDKGKINRKSNMNPQWHHTIGFWFRDCLV